jgi:prepilin-type N-terminal cleavage/methylation domain-containing protein
MLKIKRKLSQEGFSLIELMVAIVILALAIFGIFQAYSTGFMGMADARDRTVATNYLQEMIEDYKNMYFDEIQNKPMSPIPDTKYSQGAIVILEDKEDEYDEIVTQKRVIAQIRWIDRDGDVKTEKASTLIYKKSETSEEGTEAIELVLYAQSYYTILPKTKINLVAEIRDENGNIYNDYNGAITFSIITDPVVELGTLPPGIATTDPPIILYNVGAINGVAECVFIAREGEDVEGIERIKASANVNDNELTDTVNIRVTTGPVAILLEPPVDAEDNIISYPAEIGQSVAIDLTIVKADYEEEADSYSGSIDLSVEGPGTLSTNEIILSGTTTASFIVNSNGTPGVVEITASASDLDMGYTEINFYGEPASILVKPEKTSVYPDEHLIVAITIMDENNFPVDYSGNLTLSWSPDYGVFNPNPGTLSSSSLETTFTVDPGAPVGTSITLEATGDGGISGSAEITVISPLTAKYIRLSADPSSADLSNGEISTTITATIFDEDWKIVPTYNEIITFYAKVNGTDFGLFSSNFIDPSLSGGEVIVDLESNLAGTVIVTAISGDLELDPEGGLEVIFYNSAHHIELSADPSIIEEGGNDTSIITGIVYDSAWNKVINYGENG